MALWMSPAQSALALIHIFAGGNSPSVQAAPHSQQEGSLTLADAQHASEPASLNTAQSETGGMGLKKVHTASADADGDEVGSLAAQVGLPSTFAAARWQHVTTLQAAEGLCWANLMSVQLCSAVNSTRRTC